ncbi:hypothetical protein [Amycolatopsis pithecellobii]|uniref:DUF3618 domain-containing protein n=1 Tax=Amycolatopsis pithecellobii TaxID=664692 RepID=A0A6N7Z8X8_9PSEU|nr:hypothetical protein [Amycolatopsis pithecellobii]MTD57346.1 hypothetical protein [Amycolatopsis pithecellobii]
MPEDFPIDSEQARLDAELTRQELAETARELTHKASKAAIAAGALLGLGLVLIIVGRRYAAR